MKIITGILTLSYLFTMLYLGFAGSQISWHKYPNNPVLYNGFSGSWNSGGVYAPFVIRDGGILHMWYTGYRSAFPYEDQIGYAVSIDGIEWYRNDPPVLRPDTTGGWDSAMVIMPFVLKDGDTLKMWYHGSDSPYVTKFRIGYATSVNGVDWTKYPDPVLPLGPSSWDEKCLWGCSVLYDNNTYHMWYAGGEYGGRPFNACIGYATSSDGISWTKDTLHNPVFSGSGSSWDSAGVYSPHVIKDGDTLKMWYSGRDGQFSHKFNRIGFAISLDGGLSWKADSLPVLDVGDPGYWDEYFVQNACVLLDGSNSYMWYDGAGGGFWNLIGLATEIPVGIDYQNLSNLPMSHRLNQNYPNPFNPTTRISWQLAVGNFVNLSIYNVAGERIITLVNRTYPAGLHTVEWDASQLSSGVYLYRIQAGEYVETKKMILMK
jgi:predicted GH43/DUF377 family glycosyl hydrolase